MNGLSRVTPSSRRNRRSPPPRRAGLTLVEVLLALFLLTTGLTVLVSTTARCLAVARQARHVATARRLLAQVELEHPLGILEPVEAGVQRGRFGAPFQAYQWERLVEEAGEEDEEGFFAVTLSVLWSDRGGESRETVHTYLFAPEQPEGGVFSRGP